MATCHQVGKVLPRVTTGGKEHVAPRGSKERVAPRGSKEVACTYMK